MLYENEMPVGRARDLRNQKFGRWTPIYRIKKEGSKKTYWHCKCDCGKEKDVEASSLLRNISQSCGCLHNELLGQSNINNKLIDIAGKRFGKLTVLSRVSGNHNGAIWKCKCDCSNIVSINSFHLRHDMSHSCGCLRSKGEEKIGYLLRLHNIPFEKEKTFETCILPSGYKARFDFYVNNRYIIEYDGRQHFFYEASGWNTEEQFQKTQQHDNFKNQWCKDNNIPIIRIPYTKLDSLKIEDLIL